MPTNSTPFANDSAALLGVDTEREALEQRVVELETRLAFQEHAQSELSDALAELRAEAARNAGLLRRVLEDIKQHRGDLMADPADEPPPPHY
jgi:SlyX protein